MARVPNNLLRDWIVQLNEVAESQYLDPGVAAELRRLAASADGFLTQGTQTVAGDKRRGLGRGLESLIPTDQVRVESIDQLRERLRRIAGEATPSE